MWKFFFYHQWQYRKAEKYLEDMETQGFRLVKAKFCFFFKFKKSVPKGAKYIFLYSFIRDGDIRFWDTEKYILEQCKGSLLCGKSLGEPCIYRVTDMKVNLAEVFLIRQIFVKRGLIQKILCTVPFIIPTCLLLCFRVPMMRSAEGIILIAIAIIAAIFALYNFIGLFSLRKRG